MSEIKKKVEAACMCSLLAFERKILNFLYFVCNRNDFLLFIRMKGLYYRTRKEKS